MSACPLTPSQLHIWKSQVISPDSPLFNQVVTIWLDDFSPHGLDDTLMALAWDKVQRLHPALLTVLDSSGSTLPTQRLDGLGSALESIHLPSSDNNPSALSDWVTDRASNGFSLETCLSDAALVRLGDKRTLLYLNIHHLVVDAWSMRLIVSSLLNQYRQLNVATSGSDKRLNETTVDTAQAYTDYLLETEAGVSAARNADDALAASVHQSDALPCFYDYKNINPQTRSIRYQVPISRQEIAEIDCLSENTELRQFNKNLFQICLHTTALAIYVHKVTGDDTIILESPVSGRMDKRWHTLAGNFMQMVRLEIPMVGDPGIAQVFSSVRDRVFESLKIIQGSTPKKLSSKPVHGVVNLINLPDVGADDNSGELTWHHTGHSDFNHPIRLHVSDWNNTGLPNVEIDLNLAYFAAQQRHRATGHLHAVYKAIIESRDTSLSKICLVGDDEQWRFTSGVVCENAGTFAPLPAIIACACAATPDSVALIDEHDEIRYRQLQLLAEQVQAFLSAQGIGKGHRVAIVSRRSIDIPLIMLGILRCGAAYVPIDHSQPLDRIRSIITESQTSCVLVDSHEAANQISKPDIPVYTFDDILARDTSVSYGDRQENLTTTAINQTAIDASHRASNAELILPTDPAYIIFTSGSTGTPKGVTISHGSLLAYLNWAKPYYALDTPIVMPFYSSMGFDMSVTSLFLPLIDSGTVRIHTEKESSDSLTVLDVMGDHNVNTVKPTPSHLTMIVDSGSPVGESIKQLIVGGEDLPCSLTRKATELFGPQIRIVNEYGPTEATVGCIVHECTGAESGTSVPIGLPISGTNAYVLNNQGQPQFEGVPGELYLSGQSLAIGYWNNADATDSAFRMHEQFNERLYRTGDIVQVIDGSIEYRGRQDRQIKLNGFRIELSEIEKTLSAHPMIKECVVVANTEWPDETTQAINLREAELHCKRCGLSSRHPQGTLNADELCVLCESFELNQQRIGAYFKSPDDLKKLARRIQASRRGHYDAVVLLSGGKDSTYAIGKLVDLGLKVFAFSLDNGYISDQAKQNIETVCKQLGVSHHYATTDHMDEIFADSLARHSNVCNGCFKTIYTLSLKFAEEHSIDYIFTGLSRGQLFETRLSNELFSDPTVPLEKIDDMVQAARIQYHAVPDATNELLNIQSVNNGELPAKIAIVDFYRFHQVQLSEMLQYLENRLDWVRPPDTGRSTNCLINDVGIHVHKIEQGFHNYSLPYSWDVRLGHKRREEALEELDDDIDSDRVASILSNIGYQPRAVDTGGNSLSAFVTTGHRYERADLDTWIEEKLPPYMQLNSITPVTSIPLNRNGKLDRRKLLALRDNQSTIDTTLSAKELLVSAIWNRFLPSQTINSNTHFFKAGGDSLSAIKCVMELRSQGYSIEPADLFRKPKLDEFTKLLKNPDETPQQPRGKAPEKFEQLDSGQRDKLKALLAKKQLQQNN